MSAPFDPKVTFTRLTRTDGGLLTKTIRPDGKGGIDKKPAAAMTAGTAETVSLPFSEFGTFLRSLKPEQAIAHGVTGRDHVNVVSAAKFVGQPNTVTRSKKYFHYPDGWGVAMFDHDPAPGRDALSPAQLFEAVTAVWPEFADLPKVVTGSTSAYVFDQTGKQLTGRESGFHAYFPCRPAAALPALAEVLLRRLWLTGHGYIFISRAGSMLVRTAFDASVFSPERIDFVAGAKCSKDCVQRLPAPDYLPGRLQENADIPLPPPLTQAEENLFDALVKADKEKKRPEAEKIRGVRMKQEVEILRTERGIGPETAEAIVKARHEGHLEPGDFIRFQDGRKPTVAEILAAPEQYHGQPCADPTEPEEGPSKAMLFVNVSGSVIIHSFLHGEQNFVLRQAGGDADAHSEQQPEAMTAEECRATGDFTLAIPTEIANPGGLISLGVSALTQPGMSPILQYALPAVFASIANAINGRLTFRGVYPSTFNARVGPTSTGKSEGDEAISAAIRRAGLVGFYGPTEFASGPGLLRALADRPRCLIMIDEGTGLFRRYGKADMVSDSKRDALLEVTTKAGGVIDKAYADERRAILIENPCVNITANATPTVFEAIENDDFYTGLMQRVDFWCYDGPALKRERATDEGNPEMDAFVSGIAAIFNANLVDGNVANQTGAARELGIAKDADDRLFEWSHEITDKMNALDDDGLRGIVSRAYHASIKYAIVHSAGTRPIEAITEPLTITDIEYGIATAWMLADWKITRLRDRVTCGDFDRDCELFKEAVRRAVRIGRTPSKAILVNRARALKNFTPNYFGQIIEALEDRGEIMTDKSGATHAYYLTRQ